MAKNNFKTLGNLLIAVFLALGLSIPFQSVLADWAAPVSAPPACAPGDPGCDAPLNVGSFPPTKYGALKVNLDNILSTGLVAYGNAGLGTITPGSRLTVQGPDDATGGIILRTSAGNNYGVIYNAGDDDLYIQNYRTAADKIFLGTVGNAQTMTISGGNVGIGTTGPGGRVAVPASGNNTFLI